MKKQAIYDNFEDGSDNKIRFLFEQGKYATFGYHPITYTKFDISTYK